MDAETQLKQASRQDLFDDSISLSTQPLTTHQLAALKQLKTWFPQANFACFSRNLPQSVNDYYTVACAKLSVPFAKTQGQSRLEVQDHIWILASLPAISDTILISIFNEHPKPFFDFIATLDAQCETADHMVHGYTDGINHTALQSRLQHSFLLMEFTAIWPKLQLSKKRAAYSSNATRESLNNNFTGLLVIFSQDPFSKLELKKRTEFELQALARNKHHLAEIALPLNLGFLEEAASENTLAENKKQDQFFLNSELSHNAEERVIAEKVINEEDHISQHTLSPQDHKMLKNIRSRSRTLKLFMLMLITVGLVIAITYFDPASLS